MPIQRDIAAYRPRIDVQFFPSLEASSVRSGIGLASIVTALLLTGCSSLAPVNSNDAYYSTGVDRSARSARTPRASSASVTATDARAKLIDITTEWTGTPYAYGGSSRNGIDCSAFVQVLYKNAFETTLPRSTDAQRKVGKSVRRSSLQIGDLVFFDTGPRQSHVGVYIGGGEFAHSASSTGVTISNLSDSYWNKTFQHGIRPESVEFLATSAASDRLERLEPATIDEPIRTVKPATLPNERRGW